MGLAVAHRKEKFAIISYFQKKYKERLGKGLVVNKYQAQWDADALIGSYGVELLKDMIDRYFLLSSYPTWRNFCRDAQKVYEGMLDEQADLKHRHYIKMKMKSWLEE